MDSSFRLWQTKEEDITMIDEKKMELAKQDKYYDQFLAIDKGLMSITDFIAKES